MEDNKQDRALQTPAEANRDKHINYLEEEETATGNEEDIESRRRRHDADSGNDGSTIEMLQNENRLDPGNEHHHHRTDADDSIFDDDIDRTAKYDADAGGDGTGTTGPEPGEGKNDQPDTTGEDG
jgi:hypothetical protein